MHTHTRTYVYLATGKEKDYSSVASKTFQHVKWEGDLSCFVAELGKFLKIDGIGNKIPNTIKRLIKKTTLMKISAAISNRDTYEARYFEMLLDIDPL
ncbi:hypothetical protein scyTo_0006873 [Scyliorhinus torazame]|uniref:Uncharacterized protein n=1 Tax=Scyliorhinus torazame TaxID=75743 RepID=A0A401NHS8_SCYTO|nr:hypothetical protein [Scyliorhinus torazame]